MNAVRTLTKSIGVSLAILLIGLAALVMLAPSYPSLSKYVLDPIIYRISMYSYESIPLTEMAPFQGADQVGQTLTAGAVTPDGATVSYQWQKSASANGPYADIEGADAYTYTLTTDDVGYYIVLSVTGNGVYDGTLTSPYKGPVSAKPFSNPIIPGVSFPITGEPAAMSLPETTEYTAAISWDPAIPADGLFRAATEYTATITLTPKPGYTAIGVPHDFFQAEGAASVHNPVDTGIVTAVFPGTDKIPVTEISPIAGSAMVHETLTAGTPTPGDADVTYQWLKSDAEHGTYQKIAGATSNTYSLTTGDYTRWIKVSAAGINAYSGTITSAPVGPVAAKPISQRTVSGISIPVMGVTGSTTVTATEEFTGSVTWNPALSDGKFEGNKDYTATIVLTAKPGFTTAGIGTDFFTVAGAMTVTNDADSGVITATFPSTTTTAVTSIGGIYGLSRVAETLTAGAVSPGGATVSYRWEWSTSAAGPYEAIPNASGPDKTTYAVTAADLNRYIRVTATGTGNYAGTVISAYKGPVGAKTIDIPYARVLPFPETGVPAAAAIEETSQFTGTVSWSPAIAGEYYAADTAYTATIQLTAKHGYTLTGVPPAFFVSPGAYSAYHDANSGLITVHFPNTDKTLVTAIGDISGTTEVSETLTAGAVTPADATVSYQWSRSDALDGPYTAIPGATASTYVLTGADLGKYLHVYVSGTGDFTGHAISSNAGPILPKTINIKTISGVTVPAAGAAAPTAIAANSQFTGSIAWSPAPEEDGQFSAGDVYAATITLTPKTGFTLAGVDTNFFMVAGAASVIHAANSGVVTAVFPQTDTIALTGVSSIRGISRVGETLTAGSLTPAAATASWQWQKSLNAAGPYTDISGATADTYVLQVTDNDCYIRLQATGTDDYSGTKYSAYKGPVDPKTIGIASIASYASFPQTGVTASSIIVPNEEYSGTILWLPAPADGKFEANTTYTARVTITPNEGYTTEGLPENFFVVNGADTVTSAADGNIVLAVFPNTGETPITSVAGVNGSARVGQTITVGDVLPIGATTAFQWQTGSQPTGEYTDIAGATSASYQVKVSDLGKYLRVLVFGTGDYAGRIYSPYKGPVERSPYTMSEISGIQAPANLMTAQTAIPETSQFTGSISWSPALIDGAFAGNTTYTATITLSPKDGYTESGIPADFFTVPGSLSATNNPSSNIVVVTYPATGSAALTAIDGIRGIEAIGQTLRAGALTPSDATVTYIWEESDTPFTGYIPIPGATTDTYVVTEADIGHYFRVTATGTGSYSGSVTSAYKGPVEKNRISLSEIFGVSAPVSGGTAATAITETAQYSGTVVWSPIPVNGVFQPATIYTATITLEPKPTYTVHGLLPGFFSVDGAESVSYMANGTTVTAIFPSTARTQLTAISGIRGVEQVGRLLTAGDVTPADAAVKYQWQWSANSESGYINIPGANARVYTVAAGYQDSYLRVVVTGSGDFTGSVISPYKGPVTAAPISISKITGLTAPVKGGTPVTVLPETNEYTAAVSWSPVPNGTFAVNTVYTATVILAPKAGYTVSGVPKNFFTDNRAEYVTNAANSGTITIVFPSTEYTLLTDLAMPAGSATVGSTLTAGMLTPADADVTWQWQTSLTAAGPFVNIPGATGSSYTLTADDYTDYLRVKATGANQFQGTVHSDIVGPVLEGPVTLQTIPGIPIPIKDAAAAAGSIETEQFTGTFIWEPVPEGGKFAGNTSYTARITLTPEYGYTLNGVADHFFTVAGAAAAYTAGSDTVYAAFPNTAKTPILSVGGARGMERVGERLFAGRTDPELATVTYRWLKSDTADGQYYPIEGATDSTYRLGLSDAGCYLKLEVTGTGDYYGSATSPYKGAIEAARISISDIGGVSYPTLNGVPTFTISETDQYTGTIEWQPSLTANQTFGGSLQYTAKITLTAKPGYTVEGVSENFYTVLGATDVKHATGSGIIYATFPCTGRTPITAIANISGTAKVDQVLTAGAVTPGGATVTYQWQQSTGSSGPFQDIAGATDASYTIAASDHNTYIRVLAFGTDEFSGVQSSDVVGPVQAATVNILTIEGLPIPVKNMVPVYTVTETDQYTGMVSWSPDPNQNSGKFKQNTAYTATITLTPKPGYTLTGITKDSFTVVGAASTSNPVNSGIITATYPRTRSAPINAIEPIQGFPVVKEVLTAGAIDPAGAAVLYQWWRSETPDGTYSEIVGATEFTYTLTEDDVDQYIQVSVTGYGDYIGEVFSPYKGPVLPASISLFAIEGVAVPVTGETAPTLITETDQYTGTVSWSPQPADYSFQADTVYTATITIEPKAGYTLVGVSENAFILEGASLITNEANDGIVTVHFPATEAAVADAMSLTPMPAEDSVSPEPAKMTAAPDTAADLQSLQTEPVIEYSLPPDEDENILNPEEHDALPTETTASP